MNKNLLKFIMYKKIRLICRLQILNRKQLRVFLNQSGFKSEADIFYSEKIDGISFIIIFSESSCIDFLNIFTQEQILPLKEFYLMIYYFRLKNKCAKKNEKPCYSKINCL